MNIYRKISKNVEKKFEIVLEKDEYLINKKGETKEYSRVIKYNDNLKAPIEKGTVVGVVQTVDSDGNVLKSANLIVNDDVKKSSLWDYIVYVINTYIMRELKSDIKM